MDIAANYYWSKLLRFSSDPECARCDAASFDASNICCTFVKPALSNEVTDDRDCL